MAELQKHRIGIFGISCTGKSTLINGLKSLGYENVFESSALIQDPKVGGVSIAQFRESSKEIQLEIRSKVIAHLSERGQQGGIITTGHFSLATVDPASGEMILEDIFNDLDRGFYTEIILIGGQASEILNRRAAGEIAEPGKRPMLTQEQIKEWLQHEEAGLIIGCREAKILLHWFEPLPGNENADRNAQQFAKLIDAICGHSEARNAENIERHVEGLFGKQILEDPKRAPVFLLIDGDRTLSIQDTGILFWDLIDGAAYAKDFKAIFKTHGHGYFAFLQAAAMYAKLSVGDYASVCANVVSQTKLHPEFIDFLKSVTKAPQATGVVVPIVITSGNVDVWRALVQRDIGQEIAVIGGNLTPHGKSFVLDASGKGLSADTLGKLHPRCKILAFGDGEADLAMFAAADESYLVVDYKNNESLRYRLNADGPFVHLKRKLKKIVFQEYADCFHGNGEQDEFKLTTIDAILFSLPPANFKEFTATNASKLFATESRDATNFGLSLCEIHEQAGAFLGTVIVDDLELEATERKHVQGGKTFIGDAIANVSKIGIVAMMRSGEPLARGIWKLPFFNTAMFIHYNSPSDIEKYTAVGIKHFVFIDAVINSGKAVREILDHVTGGGGGGGDFKFRAKVSVVAGVVQKAAAESLPFEYPAVQFYALRTSGNSYKGVGGTDTGHRLFNTTIID